VTELVTQLDLVRLQLAVAAGERLPLTGRAPRSGHAIEIRINAEDPSLAFRPSPGRLERFRAPLGPGVRVDTFVEDGTVIPPHYDSLIAKVVVRDENRAACIERARRVLRELDVRGVPTTRDAAIDILGSDEFRSGEYSTSFIEEAAARLPALAGAA
jgi:acetyl-CoA carboxylase biotin carboxylase subunit